MTKPAPRITKPRAAIAAMSLNRVIGYKQALPWHLPADLKRFKEITTGSSVLMGRQTFQSIGKPLPNRNNIVITHDSNFHHPGCQVANSLEEAYLLADIAKEGKCFVIGGGQIYAESLPDIETLYLTIVEIETEGDTFFPELKTDEWLEIHREHHAPDEKNHHPYTFLELQRKPQST